MDLTMVGVGLLIGHSILSILRQDRYDLINFAVTALCLLLIVGSRYHLFGG
jgi:hypothetical protein